VSLSMRGWRVAWCTGSSSRANGFSDLLVALVGNLVSYLRIKLKTENVTPDTTFRFNSKDT
jgi:hypothetical protein